MTVDLDQQIRDALHAEADDLAADPRSESAWQRLEPAATAAPSRFRARPILAVLAVAAIAAALFAVVVRPDDDVKVINPATTLPDNVTTPTTSAGTTLTSIAEPVGGVQPGVDFVGVRKSDGKLVRVDLAHKGLERVLADLQFSAGECATGLCIHHVSLTPDGKTAYFDADGDDGTSFIHSVPTDGSAPQRLVIEGSSPVVSPNGDELAFLTDGMETKDGAALYETGQLAVMTLTDSDEVPADTIIGRSTESGLQELAWLSDGRIAAVRTRSAPTQIVTFVVHDSGPQFDQVISPADASYRLPQEGDAGVVYAVNNCCGDVEPTGQIERIQPSRQEYDFVKWFIGLDRGRDGSLLATWADGTVSSLELKADGSTSETTYDTQGRFFTATW